MQTDDTPKQWFTALHTDLKELGKEVQGIKLTLATMSGEKIGTQLEQHQAKIEHLEAFKNRIIGAIIIINVFWGVIAGLVVSLILWYIQNKK